MSIFQDGYHGSTGSKGSTGSNGSTAGSTIGAFDPDLEECMVCLHRRLAQYCEANSITGANKKITGSTLKAAVVHSDH